MSKTLMAVILLCFANAGISFAQASLGNTRTFTGDLQLYPSHQVGKVKLLPRGSCWVEFKSPVAFSIEPASKIPVSLTYTIKFEETVFDNFLIKVHTNDEQDFTIDPAKETTPPGPNGEHSITDPYMIYLILSPEKISSIDVVDPTGNVGHYLMAKSRVS